MFPGRADHLLLDNQFVCSSLGISPALSIPWLPVILLCRVEALWSFLYPFGMSTDGILVHIAMLVRLHVCSFSDIPRRQNPTRNPYSGSQSFCTHFCTDLWVWAFRSGLVLYLSVGTTSRPSPLCSVMHFCDSLCCIERFPWWRERTNLSVYLSRQMLRIYIVRDHIHLVKWQL